MELTKRSDNFDDRFSPTALDQGATCCLNKHPTFYGTVTQSPEWALWEKHVSEQCGLQTGFDPCTGKFTTEEDKLLWHSLDIWDVDECRECGFISPEHFASFIRFVKTLS